jgi:hypothetical protein
MVPVSIPRLLQGWGIFFHPAGPLILSSHKRTHHRHTWIACRVRNGAPTRRARRLISSRQFSRLIEI